MLVESTPNKVYDERVELSQRIQGLREDQNMEIGIGLETVDDFIRILCLNKGYHKEDFEKAIDHILKLPQHHRSRISVVGYVLVKPPWLTENEAIKDAVKTIAYLHSLSEQKAISILPALEPTIISGGTLLSYLWERNEYEPLNYWSVLEVLCAIYYHEECAAILSKIRIGTRGDMDDSAKMPAVYGKDGRYDKYDFVIYKAIQSFNQHGDLSRTFSIMASVYKLEGTTIDNYSESLVCWISKFFPKNDSNIQRYLAENEVSIEEIQQEKKINEDAMYIHKLFKFLNYVEGHEGEDYVNWAVSWNEKIEKCSSPEKYEDILREITECLEKTLKVFVKYSKLTVEEVYIEKVNERILRVKMHIFDSIKLNSYEVWSGTPINI